MSAKKPRPDSYTSVIADLPRAFCAAEDDAANARAYASYLADPTFATRQVLIEQYLPIASKIAYGLHRAYAGMPDIEDMIAEAAIALMVAADKCLKFRPDRFGGYATFTIRRLLWRAVVKWAWGGEQRRERKKTVIRRFRKQFVARTGQLPTRDEVQAHLRSLITNPNIVIEVSRKMVDAASLSDDECENLSNRAAVLDDEYSPDALAFRADAMRIAFNGLDEVERDILKRTLRGESPKQIGAQYGWTRGTSYNRVNGLLWRLRCNATLADHFDCEPATLPGSNVGKWKRIATLAAARKVG